MARLGGCGGKLLLLLGSSFLSLLAVEAFFQLRGRSQPPRPAVFYATEDPGVQLWCYDDCFQGVADYDLTQDHPFEHLEYLGNIDSDPALADLPPRYVPRAIEVRKNERKFRERSFAALQRARPGAPVTLLIGDSFCFGQGVRVQDRFSDLLEARLRRAVADSTGRGPLLVNLCAPGVNIRFIYRVLEKYIDHFENVQRVIYSFTLNDPLRTREIARMETAINDFMHFREYRFAHAFRPALRTWPSATLRFFAERMAMRQVSRDTIAWYKLLYGDQPGWGQTRQALADMRSLCAAREVETVLLVFPIFYRLADYPLREVHEELGRVARDLGMRHIDLLDLFAGKEASEYWVHPKDFHPNTRAHREVAEFLQTALPW